MAQRNTQGALCEISASLRRRLSGLMSRMISLNLPGVYSDNQRLGVAALYVLLIAGGLWQLLGVFQNLMRILAAPVMVAIAFLSFREVMLGMPNAARRRLRLWALAVVVLGFLVELAGVKTGLIFGDYSYGKTLRPTLGGTPVVIGLAWLSMTLTSLGVVRRFRGGRALTDSPFLSATFGAAMMALFDIAMEPAAVRIGYWSWAGGTVPLQNYLAWFGLGWIACYSAVRLGFFDGGRHRLLPHLYLSQIFYFGILWFV